MNQRDGAGTRFPGERPFVPTLFEISVVVWVWNARPANQGRLNALARAIRKVEQPDAFRREQPLVTGPRRNVDQLRLNVDGNNSQRLNHVNYQQRVVRPGRTSEALKISAKAGGILNLANRHQPRASIDHAGEFIDIDTTAALFGKSHFDARNVSQP